MSREELVGIREACQIINVSENALRQWTDEGKIKAFVTPGGHRRYLESDLRKFVNSSHRSVGIKDLVIELEDTIEPLREIAKTSICTKSWYAKLDLDSQRRLSMLGRNMLQVIIKFITEPSRREETMKTAHEIGHDFGQVLAKSGLPLTDSVEAFVLHRDPIMQTATNLLKRKESLKGNVIEAIPLMTHVIDEALVSLVTAYQLETKRNKE